MKLTSKKDKRGPENIFCHSLVTNWNHLLQWRPRHLDESIKLKCVGEKDGEGD